MQEAANISSSLKEEKSQVKSVSRVVSISLRRPTSRYATRYTASLFEYLFSRSVAPPVSREGEETFSWQRGAYRWLDVLSTRVASLKQSKEPN